MNKNSYKIAIIGPAHPLRGGIAAFNERLAREFIKERHQVDIYTFSYQYPSFLFPGKTQYSSDPAPDDLNIEISINSINPLNWIKIGRRIRKSKPDIVIVRYWIPLMAPCLGTIIRIIRKNKSIRIVCIADNITPHEKRIGDRAFTRYFINSVDAFVVMSREVLAQLQSFKQNKPVEMIPHPLYDHFGQKIPKEEARKRLKIDPDSRVMLFFGFIRKYKGLDILLDAIKLLIRKPENENLKLLIAGEFYENKKNFDVWLTDPLLSQHIILHDHFIPDSDVKYYLCASDVTVQPYRSATQSGVTPLSYHFDIPMIVTNVGGLPDMVQDGISGLIAEPTPDSIAEKIDAYFKAGEQSFIAGLLSQKQQYTWKRLVDVILRLSKSDDSAEAEA